MERHREFRRWKETRDQLHHVQYKALRNRVTNSLRKDVKKSEQKFVENITQETKSNKMWKAVAKKAGWKQNLAPTSIKSGPTLLLT